MGDCRIHPDKVSVYYCSDHVDWVCLECGQTDHIDCVNVTNTPEIPEKMKAMIESLRKVDKDSRCLQNSLYNHLGNIVKEEEDMFEYVEKVRSTLNSFIDSFKAETDKCKDNIQKDIEKCQRRIHAVREYLTDIDHEIKRRKYQSGGYENMESLEDDLVNKTNENEIPKQNPSLSLHKDRVEEMLNRIILRKNNTVDVGTQTQEAELLSQASESTDLVKVRKTATNTETIETAKTGTQTVDVEFSGDLRKKKIAASDKDKSKGAKTTPEAHGGATTKDGAAVEKNYQKYKIVLKQSMRVTDGDKCCHIKGAVVLGDGRIVAVDLGKKFITLLGSVSGKSGIDGNILQHLRLSGLPGDVSIITKNQIAVTISLERQVQLIDVSEQLSLGRALSTPEECYGISHYRGILILTGSLFTGHVIIMTLDGTTLKIIGEDACGGWMFCQPNKVAVCTDGTLCVTDTYRKRMTKITQEGEILGRYAPDENYYYGIAVHPIDGTIFLGLTGGLLRLTPEGTRIQTFNFSGTYHSICFSNEEEMIVTTREGIQMYSLMQLHVPSY